MIKKNMVKFLILLTSFIANDLFCGDSEKKEKIEVIDPKLLAENTAKIISQFYLELGPKIGSRLVDPNPLLAISGLRVQGHFSVHNLTDQEKKKVEKLNEKIKDQGISFTIFSMGLSDDEFFIKNLKGLEHLSNQTKFPFIEPYNSATGTEGEAAWTLRMFSAAKSALNTKTTHEEQSFLHFFDGFLFGYPDQALIDGYNEGKLGNDKVGSSTYKMIISKIPYADYDNNETSPNFFFLPENANEKSIKERIKVWGEFFEAFYNTSWHKSIIQDPVFKKMRKLEKKALNGDKCCTIL